MVDLILKGDDLVNDVVLRTSLVNVPADGIGGPFSIVEIYGLQDRPPVVEDEDIDTSVEKALVAYLDKNKKYTLSDFEILSGTYDLTVSIRDDRGVSSSLTPYTTTTTTSTSTTTTTTTVA